MVPNNPTAGAIWSLLYPAVIKNNVLVMIRVMVMNFMESSELIRLVLIKNTSIMTINNPKLNTMIDNWNSNRVSGLTSESGPSGSCFGSLSADFGPLLRFKLTVTGCFKVSAL